MKFKKIKTVILNPFGIKGAIMAIDQDGEQIPELNKESDKEGFWTERIKTYWSDSDTEFVDQSDYKPKSPF